MSKSLSPDTEQTIKEGLVNELYAKAYNQGIDHSVRVVEEIFNSRGNPHSEAFITAAIIRELTSLKVPPKNYELNKLKSNEKTI